MPYPGFDLTGKRALVTGGTSGLGRAIAVGLAKSGATVVVASREEAKVADAVAELRDLSGGHSGLQLDVADADSIAAAFQRVAGEHERLDILVNAAGVIQKKDPLE